jgi:uncharacterized membrane protein YgcG
VRVLSATTTRLPLPLCVCVCACTRVRAHVLSRCCCLTAAVSLLLSCAPCGYHAAAVPSPLSRRLPPQVRCLVGALRHWRRLQLGARPAAALCTLLFLAAAHHNFNLNYARARAGVLEDTFPTGRGRAAADGGLPLWEVCLYWGVPVLFFALPSLHMLAAGSVGDLSLVAVTQTTLVLGWALHILERFALDMLCAPVGGWLGLLTSPTGGKKGPARCSLWPAYLLPTHCPHPPPPTTLTGPVVASCNNAALFRSPHPRTPLSVARNDERRRSFPRAYRRDAADGLFDGEGAGRVGGRTGRGGGGGGGGGGRKGEAGLSNAAAAVLVLGRRGGWRVAGGGWRVAGGACAAQEQEKTENGEQSPLTPLAWISLFFTPVFIPLARRSHHCCRVRVPTPHTKPLFLL